MRGSDVRACSTDRRTVCDAEESAIALRLGLMRRDVKHRRDEIDANADAKAGERR
jgi:hypothetical protein